MFPFSLNAWIYAVKLLAACFCAYILSIYLNLTQANWAIVTCCVLMNPYSAAFRAKSSQRLAGTVLAGISAYLVTKALGNTPLFLVVITGVIVSFSLAMAVLSQTSKTYGFQVYAITLLFVEVASFEHLDTVFSIAVTRTTEIMIGVFCCIIIDAIIVPNSLRKSLYQRMDNWLLPVEKWLTEMLQGELTSKSDMDQTKQKLISDLTSFTKMIAQLRYDHKIHFLESKCAIAIQQRMLRLIPLLSSIELHLLNLPEADRHAALAYCGALLRDNRTLATAAGIKLAKSNEVSSWPALVSYSLAQEIKLAIRLWHEVIKIQKFMNNVDGLNIEQIKEITHSQKFSLMPDFYMAGNMLLATSLSYALVMGLWWVTGWDQSPNVVLLAAIAIGVFGFVQESSKLVISFGKVSALALPLAYIMNEGLLLFQSNFIIFSLLMSLVIIPLGLFAFSNTMYVLLLAMIFSSVYLQTSLTASHLDNFLGLAGSGMLGILVGYLCIHAIKKVTFIPLLKRVYRRTKQDIVSLAAQANEQTLAVFTSKILNRISELSVQPFVKNYQHGPSLIVLFQLGMAIGKIRTALNTIGGKRRRLCNLLLEEFSQNMNNDLLRQNSQFAANLENAIMAAAQRSRENTDNLLEGLIELKLALSALGTSPLKVHHD